MKQQKQLNLLSKSKSTLKMEFIRTPKEIWESLDKEFDFTTDACASDKNHLCPLYWTKEDDALKQDWNDQVIYCHPMYDGKIPKFIEKAVNSNSLCVFLLPSSTNAVYFHEYIWNKDTNSPYPNVELRFLEKPKGLYGYRFATDDGDLPKTGYLRPLMIVIFNKKSDDEA